KGGTEHRFDAADQAALFALDIGGDGGAPDQRRAGGTVEDRARNGALAAFKRRQYRRAVRECAERRVRRAEIEAAGGHCADALRRVVATKTPPSTSRNPTMWNRCISSPRNRIARIEPKT